MEMTEEHSSSGHVTVHRHENLKKNVQ